MKKQTQLLGIALLAASVSRGTLARAQDAPPPPPSTVVKNLSPVDLTPLDLRIPPAKEYVLPNGSRIFIVEDNRTPLVAFTISLRGGSLFEADTERGLADLVAASLVEGTTSYTGAQIAELADKYGATFGASADDERVSVTLRCLVENADELLPVLQELAYAPTFPADAVAKVQKRAAANASARANDPVAVAGEGRAGAALRLGELAAPGGGGVFGIGSLERNRGGHRTNLGYGLLVEAGRDLI